MCLSYLSLDKFKFMKEEIKFNEQIKKFENDYKNNNENDDVNKKTVINLCLILFHSDNSKDLNTNSNENFIKPNEPLIFESFRDEIL